MYLETNKKFTQLNNDKQTNEYNSTYSHYTKSLTQL